MSKINNIGRADAQPISPETWEAAMQEIEQLQRTINEQAKQIDSLEHRLGNQAVTIKTLSATLSRQVEEAIKLNTEREQIARALSLPIDEPNLAGIAKSIFDDYIALAFSNNQAQAVAPNTLAPVDINRFVETKEPPLTTKTVNVSGEADWTGEWRNYKGWRVPYVRESYIKWQSDTESLYWRLSIESGWVKAEKWQEPVRVHPAPNVTIAGGE